MESFNEIWPISDAVSEGISIYDGPEVFLSDFGKASRAHQVVFAARWFQAEVWNGGLTQFFANDTGVLAPEAVEAFRVVGLPRLAEKLEVAMSWFGASYPRERRIRQQALEDYAKINGGASIYHKNPFEKLTDEVVKLIDNENAGLDAAGLEFVRTYGS